MKTFRIDLKMFMGEDILKKLFYILTGEDNQACLPTVRNARLPKVLKYVDLKF